MENAWGLIYKRFVNIEAKDHEQIKKYVVKWVPYKNLCGNAFYNTKIKYVIFMFY